MPLLKEKITLYLAPWQVRMAKDFLPSKFRKFERLEIIKFIDKRHWVMYRVPIDKLRNWVLYLTDEQIAIVKAKFNIKTAVSGININEAMLQSGEIAFK